MNAEQEQQIWLIELVQHIKQTRPISVPKFASIHIAPDSAWIAIEHEYQEEQLVEGVEPCLADIAVICERKPPSCHTILAKI